MDEKERSEFDDELQTAFDEEIKSFKRPTVLICGYTGSGKTSLIQSICGKSIVPDDRIKHFAPGTKSFVEYSSPLIRIWDSQGLEPGNSEIDFLSKTKNFVRDVQRKHSVDDHIHIVWYCIQGAGARVTPTDERLIKEIFDSENTLVLITKNDITSHDQREGMTSLLIEKGISRDMIIPIAYNDHSSLEKLIQRTIDILPEAYKDAFTAAQILSVKKKEAQAHKFIHTSAFAAGAAGAIPIPGPDAPIITGIQFNMMARLAILYGFDVNMLKRAIGPELAKLVGRQLVRSLTKAIPFLGPSINAIVAASITEALGWHVQHYLKNAAISKINGEPVNDFKFEWSEFEKLFGQIFSTRKQDS